MHRFKRSTAVLMAAACLFSAASAVGCSEKDESSDDTTSEYVVPVPAKEDRVPEDSAGEQIDATVAETVNYKDKVTVSLNAVRELDAFSGSSGRILFCEVTITNNTDQVLDLSYLTHFSLAADGSASEVGRSALANSQATKYYHESNLKLLHTPVPAKGTEGAENSVTGVVAVLAPSKWESLQLVYMPYKYYSNDTVDFEIKEDKIFHINSASAK